MNKNELFSVFQNPGPEWRGKPFWSWNGELRKEEILRQINVMKEMGLGGYFMHSRAGLITEYLGDEWFDLINAGADEGEKLGMESWLYDEDRYPSGTAGGKVTEDERYREKSIVLREEAPETFVRTDDMLFVFIARLDGVKLYAYEPVKKGEALEDVIRRQNADGLPGLWRTVSFSIVFDAPDSNFNGTTYLDAMNAEATRRFIELTHDEYAKRCGDRMGQSIKGIFTDEPRRGTGMGDRKETNGVITCSMSWTDDLFDEFIKRYGYDARPILPELFYQKNGERFAKIKHDYFDLADNLFLERFAKPIADWCKEHNFIFTGHVLHEDNLSNQAEPHGSLMRFYPYMDYPGIDILSEGNRCYWVPKQLSSVTRQTGQKWLLSELYGCTGWQMSMKGHKAVGDWQALFGINLRCQHLSWYTMEGEAKRDYPASILHQSPWYRYYAFVESYFARLGAFLTEGKPQCDVLVLNPIESAWSQAYAGWSRWIFATDSHVLALESAYRQTFMWLTGHHIDFDYGEEQLLTEMASVENDRLRVGQMTYKTVVIAGMDTIRPSTLKLLKDFMAAGGTVIVAGAAPAYVDGEHSSAPEALLANALHVPFAEQALTDAVKAHTACGISVENEDGTAATNVFVQARAFGSDAGFVLLNTDRDHPTGTLAVRLQTSCRHAEAWDLTTGRRYNADARLSFENGTACLRTTLDAAGTQAFLLCETADKTLPILPEKPVNIKKQTTIAGDFAYCLSEKNVCVLDFARAKFGDDPWTEETEILKIDRQIRKKLGLEYRGGSMLQPWFAKKYDQKHYGPLSLTFTFHIDELPAGPVFLAGERPELMNYAVNGVPLAVPDINDFWVDECFKRMEIPAGVLKTGENTVTVETEFLRTTNLEALYLVGDFGVQLDGHRRTLTSLPETLAVGNLEKSGLPFYTGEVTYRLTPDRYADFAFSGRVFLSAASFTGSLLKVRVEGEDPILLPWDPFEADVTDALAAGKTIDVTVVGTRRNVFGPLHMNPPIASSYGPGSFVTEGNAWSDDYVLIDSGLTGLALTEKE